MALTKTPIDISFANGISTKVDSKRLQIGKFLSLVNSVFDVQGRLTKRNGYADITQLPNSDQTTLTTLNNNLLATGSNLYAYSADTNQWLTQGTIQPVQLSVQSLVRVSTSQVSPDAAVASTGLTCLVYVDGGLGYYQISDSNTGQQIVSRTALPATAVSPRVFLLGRYFVITFKDTVSATGHIQYIAIPTANPSSPIAAADISASVAAGTVGYDAVVANDTLYIGWAAAGTTIKLASITSTLVVSSAVTLAAHSANLMSLAADVSASTPVIWCSFWDSGSSNMYTSAFNQALTPILAPTIMDTGTFNEITSVATAGILTLLYEVANNYNSTGAYPNTVKTDYVFRRTVNQVGTIISTGVVLRSVGLASKPFIATSGTIYVLATYGETNQPTYLLVDSMGSIYARLAYANGGGYAASQVLPTVSLLDGTYYVPYLIKDFLASTNKGTANPTGTPTNPIYTQTGVNLGKFAINASGQYSSEIANALHLTGGQLWEYDGVRPVEHGFHVWPENVASTTATGSGSIAAGTYYYAFCYEWTDNAGNLHRSAPSIPLAQVTTTASSTNTLYVPTLRLTYKIAPNPVRIVGYRWSVAQQVYYQFTSLTSPPTNDTTVDYVSITDTNSDSQILGNTLLYTTGGVIENIAAPAFSHTALYKNRLFGIDAEDPNLIWYSKQVIENTPVEMSDLLTLYVSPTTGSQGSTGPLKALSAMDDKLIMFKAAAAYYLVGQGPDNTGANNDFTDPVYITASVGCSNPNSIVLTPNGLMFQSEKGIWLLDRSLQTSYIGADVEAFNSYTVLSATAIPSTNQVRFILNNGVTLLYDYYYNQWGTFSNTSAISATLYENEHTYLNQYGHVFQETPGVYLDGSRPVLMSFKTGWINIAGIQGYERFYYMHLLGTYVTPFILNCQIGYDYNGSATENYPVLPDNNASAYGDEPVYGGGPAYGGPGNVFTARVFPTQQKCSSFQITMDEVYDPSYGVAAGEGLTLSAMSLTVGVKKGTRVQKASQSFG